MEQRVIREVLNLFESNAPQPAETVVIPAFFSRNPETAPLWGSVFVTGFPPRISSALPGRQHPPPVHHHQNKQQTRNGCRHGK